MERQNKKLYTRTVVLKKKNAQILYFQRLVRAGFETTARSLALAPNRKATATRAARLPHDTTAGLVNSPAQDARGQTGHGGDRAATKVEQVAKPTRGAA